MVNLGENFGPLREKLLSGLFSPGGSYGFSRNSRKVKKTYPWLCSLSAPQGPVGLKENWRKRQKWKPSWYLPFPGHLSHLQHHCKCVTWTVFTHLVNQPNDVEQYIGHLNESRKLKGWTSVCKWVGKGALSLGGLSDFMFTLVSPNFWLGGLGTCNSFGRGYIELTLKLCLTHTLFLFSLCVYWLGDVCC